MDYVYYPMVGSSTKLWWWCVSIFLTFFISGFWHGAAWTYVMSFSIFGFYLVICTLKDKPKRKFEKKHGLKKKEWWLWLNRIVTFFLVMYALVYFRANSISDAFLATKQMATNIHGKLFLNDIDHIIYAILSIVILFVAEFIIEYKKISVTEKTFLRIYSLCSIGLLILILSLGIFNGGQFIYFQF